MDPSESQLDAICRAALRQVDASGDNAARRLEVRVELAVRTIVEAGLAKLLEAAQPLRDMGSVSPEDAVQEALTAFARRVQETDFRRRMIEGRPFGFLWRMTHNRALDMLESARVRKRAVDQAVDQSGAPSCAASPPDARLLRKARSATAQALLAELSPEDQKIVYLVCVEEHTSREVAKIVGRSADSVRQRVSRALAGLRRRALVGESRRSTQ